ncbi:MAG TPA: RsmE family RNA methyltransferase [Spirochaetia bacterium]|nr:RsmE family RNA methyltransferase [Spirochaetia bacterium]
MKQLLLPREYAGEPRITLTGSQFRHLARARRMREGDRLPALDHGGARYSLRITRVGTDRCEVAVEPVADSHPNAGRAPAVRLTLLQCLPKGRKTDLIVRQATEAGVSRIILLVSDHCVVRPDGDEHRVSRLVRVAREALQQSGGAALPRIEGPRPFSAIGEGRWDAGLLLSERPADGPSLHELLAGGPGEVALLVGPEGGLSEAETTLALAAGFRPVHLRTGVLRVETAVTFALGAVMTILQEKDEWTTGRGSGT